MREQPEETEREENAESQLDRLKEEEAKFGRPLQVRTVIAMAALAGMLLPWLKLDGYGETMTAAELIAYAIADPERGTMFGVSKLGAMAVLFMPGITLAAVVYGFFKTINGQPSLAAYLTGGCGVPC